MHMNISSPKWQSIYPEGEESEYGFLFSHHPLRPHLMNHDCGMGLLYSHLKFYQLLWLKFLRPLETARIIIVQIASKSIATWTSENIYKNMINLKKKKKERWRHYQTSLTFCSETHVRFCIMNSTNYVLAFITYFIVLNHLDLIYLSRFK